MTRSLRTVALRALLVASSLVAPRIAHADDLPGGYPEEVIQWGVQKGESCEDIAKALYGNAKWVPLLFRYNRITCTRGAPLKPGITLVLPAKVTDVPTARIKALQPAVRAKPPGGGWAPAASGQPLTTSSNVNTLEDARADIQFIDRTRVFMAENTLVVIYGTASQTGVSKSPPPLVELDQGEVKATLSALRGDDTQKPAVEVALNGGGRVSAASKDTVVARKETRTTVAVFNGNARVENAHKSVLVPTNFGTRFVGAAAPEAPRPLPPAPVWDARSHSHVALGPKGRSVLEASWAPVAKARAYRVEVARDASFEDLVVRQEVAAKTLAFRAERLPVGTYFIRARAIDLEDFLGIAATPIQVAVVEVDWTDGTGRLGDIAPPSTNTGPASPVDDASKRPGALSGAAPEGSIITSPYARVSLAAPPGAELAFGDGPFVAAPARVDFRTAHPDKVKLRVGGPSGITTELAVVYVPVTAELRIGSGPPAQGRTNPGELEVAFGGTEAIDIAKTLRPIVKIHRRVATTERVDSVALTAPSQGSTVWRAALASPDEITRIDVLDGDGSVLGTKTPETVTPGKPPTARAPAPASHLGLSAPGFSVSAFGAPVWWSPTAENAASIGASVEADYRDRGPADARGRVSASGTIGRVGLDAAFATDGARGKIASDGGAWFGARVRALGGERGHLELGPAIRVGFPVRLGSPRPKVATGDAPVRLEAGLGLGSQLGRWGWLVDVGTRIELDKRPAGAYAMPAFVVGGGTFDFTEWLRAHAALDFELVFDNTLSPCVRCKDDSAHPGGGLSMGLEAGTTIFGGLSGRISPFDDPWGGVSGTLSVGIRSPR